jgi:hypothetical protein
MKNALFVILQFILFVLAAVAGITLTVLGLLPSHVTHLAGARLFEWDGALLMLAVYALILIVEALRKRLRAAAPWTTLALLLAAAVEFAMKLGVRDL